MKPSQSLRRQIWLNKLQINKKQLCQRNRLERLDDTAILM